MASNLYSVLLFILILSFFRNFSLSKPLCHKTERSALMTFKQSLTINETASSKVGSWKLEEGESRNNCCSWDGVECDKSTGHVIGLDLSSSFLFGSLNSSSTLFSLVHLQSLNLADNNFNYSRIPPEIGSLSRLKILDLSRSNFSGPVPHEISKLSKLVSLNLSQGVVTDFSLPIQLLELESPGLGELLQNLTRLQVLDLTQVNVSSSVPTVLANLSSLKILVLRDCNLYGEFLMGIFHLPKLQVLSVGINEELNGVLPEFDQTSHLQTLRLDRTSFSGTIPHSIGNLSFLYELDLSYSNFFGTIPTSIGNLSQLTYLVLQNNNFSGQVPPLTGLLNLEKLKLSNNSNLNVDNMIWLVNLRNLTILLLAKIDLSNSILSTENHTRIVSDGLLSNTNLPKYIALDLSSCNLKAFPDFLRYQDELELLILDSNEIHGRIPIWLSKVSKKNLRVLTLINNSITGFEGSGKFTDWCNLKIVDLSLNAMQGELPIPPPSLHSYFAFNNSFSGELSSLICRLTSLKFLVLANNNLTGVLPQCLSNFSDSLSFLNLENNNFHGPIPQTFKEGNKLKLINLRKNQLNGKVPRSLENCKFLRSLDLSSNQVEDVLPFWLGSLPKLQLLLLGSNKFYGAIEDPKSVLDFPNLRICDLSHNNLTGYLPRKLFQQWNAMQSLTTVEDKYMVEKVEFQFKSFVTQLPIPYTMAITLKGVHTEYDKIQSIFTAIDLSSNNFHGKIPETIGNLQGLQLLNLSNNGLSGEIPSSLGNLSNLESLDVSRNKLSGKIPQQLAQLNFLGTFNVSYNNLSGFIPKGKQFNTFLNDSFVGNSGLCGDPLSRKCGVVLTPYAQSKRDDDEDGNNVFPSGVEWVVISLGFGSGLVVGIVIGRILIAKYHEWFVETFTRNKPKQQQGGREEEKKLKVVSSFYTNAYQTNK